MKPTFQPERRICMVDTYEREEGKKIERRAFFHLFTTNAYPVEPSLLKGGHPGGQVSKPVAIVEYEDGTVESVLPSRVRFLDTEGLMEQYAFGEEPERDCLTCKYNEDGTNRDLCRKCETYSEWEASEA